MILQGYHHPIQTHHQLTLTFLAAKVPGDSQLELSDWRIRHVKVHPKKNNTLVSILAIPHKNAN